MTNSITHFSAGVQAFHSGDFNTAIEQFESATRHNPEHSQAFSYLGASYAEQGRYNSAIGAFKRAAEMQPYDATSHYNLGQAYEVAGVPMEAWFEYKRALKIDPYYSLARGALSALNSRLRSGKTKGIYTES